MGGGGRPKAHDPAERNWILNPAGQGPDRQQAPTLASEPCGGRRMHGLANAHALSHRSLPNTLTSLRADVHANSHPGQAREHGMHAPPPPRRHSCCCCSRELGMPASPQRGREGSIMACHDHGCGLAHTPSWATCRQRMAPWTDRCHLRACMALEPGWQAGSKSQRVDAALRQAGRLPVAAAWARIAAKACRSLARAARRLQANQATSHHPIMAWHPRPACHGQPHRASLPATPRHSTPRNSLFLSSQ